MHTSLIIGEVAQTHDGSLGLAHAFIDSIADAGADAIKFQTHIADAESTPDEPWRVKFSKQDTTRYEYWKRMEFTESQWTGLKAHADDRGLLFLSSPFSFEAVDLLDRVGVHAWKVASGEVNNFPLLRHMLQSERKVILSSGMSSLQELDEAVELVRRAGREVAVLQCTSAYPCPPEKVGVNMLPVFRERYGCEVGLSDHSGTIYAGLAAAAIGMDYLEVHVTLSREMFGPDVPASVTTAELRQLVEGVRFIERMNANPVEKDHMAKALQPLRDLFTKSLVTTHAITAGTALTTDDLTFKKPGTGIPANSLNNVIGRVVLRDLPANTILQENDLEPSV